MPKTLIEVAAGLQPADLVLKNATVVDVFTASLYTADIAIHQGAIAGIGSYTGKEERDCTGLTAVPGFIDAHMHIESTMVLPQQLARAVLPSGTTTLVADPHEIVNVLGAKGLAFMLAASKGAVCDIHYMLPSSVPSTPFETNGANFTAEEMAPLWAEGGVLGLGEVMCYPDVLGGQAHILEKLAAAGDRPKDGHAPGLTGHALQAYAAAGIETEHECTTFEEALEKARAGLAILVREGSAAHDLKPLVTGLLQSGLDSRRFLFCTDDKHLDDIRRDGHIRWNVRLAIDLGMPPVEAIRMATLNTAQVYGLKHTGAIAPGYHADLVLLSDLSKVEVAEVYKNGVPASKLLAAPPVPVDPSAALGTVHIPPLSAEDLRLPVNGPAHVLGMVPYSLLTEHLVEEVPTKNGAFVADAIYSKLCVIERHRGTGNIAVAPLKGYGIQGGAVATSVAHDSHNIIAVGDNDEDLLLAIRHLGKLGGGYVLVQGGRVIGDVPLPIAGLMSDADSGTVQKQTGSLLEKAQKTGIPFHVDPFISLSFLALPVIPHLRLTDKGLFDVDTATLI